MSKISIVTLVNKEDVYKTCVVSSLKTQDVEHIPVREAVCASYGLNSGLEQAKHKIVVLCHQDVVFPEHWVDNLFDIIIQIDDPTFGVLGTYGVTESGRGAGHIRSGDKILDDGILPQKVTYLDEHCLVIRKHSGLRFDNSMPYWHMYGADLCLQAYSKGMTCYAIDNFLHHLSDNLGTDPALTLAVAWFKRKWTGKSRFHKYRTTCTRSFDL
jgi:hypothetical protein